MKRHSLVAIATIGTLLLASCGSSGPGIISLAKTSGSRTNFDALAGEGGDIPWMPDQNIVYDVSESLPEMASSASAYKISSPDATLSMFNSLAKTFGLTTTPEILTKSDGTYTAVNISGSAADGSASLSLTSDGSTTGWYYSDSAAWGSGTWGCVRSEPSPGTGETPPDDGCKNEVPEPTPNLPTEEQARTKASELFSDLGFNVAEARIEFSKDDYVAIVFGVETVDHMDVPLQWTATFGEDGVLLSASGIFATVRKVESYSLITPQEGVKRLTSMVYAGRPAYMAEESAIDAATSSSGSSGSGSSGSGGGTEPVPDDGAPVDGEPVTITIPITGVVMSLMQVWQTDGSSMLLPAFTYTNGDGIVGQVIAIEEKYISVPTTSDTTTPPPTPPPSTDPTSSTTPGTGTLDDTIPTIAPLSQKEADSLIGLSEEEARKVAIGRGWGFRVAARDGVSFPLTADYSPTRVNVSVVADEVSTVSVG